MTITFFCRFFFASQTEAEIFYAQSFHFQFRSVNDSQTLCFSVTDMLYQRIWSVSKSTAFADENLWNNCLFLFSKKNKMNQCSVSYARFAWKQFFECRRCFSTHDESEWKHFSFNQWWKNLFMRVQSYVHRRHVSATKKCEIQISKRDFRMSLLFHCEHWPKQSWLWSRDERTLSLSNYCHEKRNEISKNQKKNAMRMLQNEN